MTWRRKPPHEDSNFPLLRRENYTEESPPSDEYNCAAWAVEVTDDQWWPEPRVPRYKWPQGARRNGTIEAFIDGYGKLGFEVCDNPDLEDGFAKIAIYTTFAGSPKHVARQLPDGRWASKLGEGIDIYHATLNDLSAGGYGNPTHFMRRPITQDAGRSDASSS
jgi:hypothetical protein